MVICDVEALGFAGAGESDAWSGAWLRTDSKEWLWSRQSMKFWYEVLMIGEWAFFGDEDEAGWIAKGERAQEDGVYDAEDGGVRADAESEREDGDRGEAGAFCEEPEGVAKILQQSRHGFSSGTTIS